MPYVIYTPLKNLELLQINRIVSCVQLVWTSGRVSDQLGTSLANPERLLSYLPLSHIAAQIADIYASIYAGSATYFAQPDALKVKLYVNHSRWFSVRLSRKDAVLMLFLLKPTKTNTLSYIT